MDFKDQIKQLGERVIKLRGQLQTEEATKNALVLPFIQCLGYDVFNPLEVVPEFIADIGIKKGEKVDYAIMKDGKPCILIECKHIEQSLDSHSSQLFRYFHTTEAKFGILTNGTEYKIFTDLVELNKMDEKSFLEFDLTNLKENTITEIKKFHRSYFDIVQISNTASELKYCNEIRGIMLKDLSTPSEQLVKYYTAHVYPGRATERIIQQFTEHIRKTSTQILSDMISERLKSALAKEQEKQESESVKEGNEEISRIVTTEEEKEAYFLIKSILRKHVDASRIFYRDNQSYFSILLDNNNRKPICRLFLTAHKKHLFLFDEKREETRVQISGLDDLYQYADVLVKTLNNYSGQVEVSQQEISA